MKFSKIACVALLSASISTVALANTISDLADAKKDEATRTAAYGEIMKAVNDLKTIGYDNLKNWNGDKTGEGTNKLSAELNTRIYNALNTIKEAKKGILSKDGELKVAKDDSKLTITQDGTIKILIKGDKNTAVHDNGGDDQELTLNLDDFKAGNKDKIKDIFAEDNKDVWEAFIAEFTKKHNELQDERENKIDAAALAVANDLDSLVDINEEYSAYIENKSLIQNAIKADVATQKEAVKIAQGEVDKAVNTVSGDKLTLLNKDNAGITKQETDIKALTAKLTEAKNKDESAKKAALKEVVNAGVILSDGGKNLTVADIDTKDSLALDTLIGNDENSGAQKAAKDAQTEIKKVTDKIEKVTEAESKLKVSSELMAKFASIAAETTSDEG
uniref:hypothetical protein n=1 Tax=Campylobacter mucosalis TaxID=202 RepID=UPI0014708314